MNGITINRIILLGFRYCGKTTIGQQIAKMNGLKFVDLDEEIEKNEDKKIAEIVKKNGWRYFRKLEFECYKSYAGNDNVVISCGGGFAVNEYFSKEENELLKAENGVKILFEIDKKTLIERIKKSYLRPSLLGKNSNDIDKIIEENLSIYNQRKPLYDVLDFDAKIDTSHKNFVNAMENNSLFCVIGNPVWHSLSPKIHNTIYENFGLKIFVYTKIEIKEKRFNKVKQIMNLLAIKGASITSPFKQEIMKIVDEIDEKSKKIGAVNTIFFGDNGKIYGYNTDYIGVLKALEKHTNLVDKKVAIFGSGGGAKSAAIACLERTKNVILFNRTKEKNDDFATKNGIKSCALREFKPADFDVIINATIVGLGSKKSILKRNQILKNHVVFDMVYNPLKTTLLRYAISKNTNVIYGTSMLIQQAIKQVEIFTGKVPDNKIVSQIEREITTYSNSINRNIPECCVVVGNSINAFLRNLAAVQSRCDFCELRVDYIKKLSKNNINQIAENISTNSIFTCRNVANDGNFSGTIQEQKELIKYAMSLEKFAYFDIDFSQIDDWKKELNDTTKLYKIILSHHDFSRCLPYQKCVKMIDKMFESGADFAKIACKINSANNIFTMLKVLKKYKNKNKNVIFAPMTDDKIVRVLASKYGSWTNFVCLNDKKNTARGQIKIDDYNKILGLLEVKN